MAQETNKKNNEELNVDSGGGGVKTVTPQETIEATPPVTEISPKIETAPEIAKTAKEARDEVITTTEEAIDETKQQAEEIEEESKDRLEEDKQILKERESEIEAFRNEQRALIEEKDKQIAEAQKEVDRLAQQRKVRDIDILQGEAKKSKDLSDQALALEKQKSDEAIFEAKREVEMNAQRSAISFQKLGLGFSSGIILQSQAIADRGFMKIATLKAQANYNQANLVLEASKVQNSYNELINKTIDKYTDIQIANKKDIVNRINDTNNNLLLNAEQKRLEINKLKEDYISNKRLNEDNLKKEQERLTDRAIKQANDLEGAISRDRNEKLKTLNQDIVTGAMSNRTPSDIADLERQLGMTPGTVDRQFNGTISSLIRKSFDNFIGRDYAIPNTNELIEETRNEMSQGRTLDEAVTNVMSRELRTNPRYLRQQEAKRLATESKTARARGAGTSTTKLSKEELGRRASKILALGGGLLGTAESNILAKGEDEDAILLIESKALEKAKEQSAKKKKKPELSEGAKSLLKRRGTGFFDLEKEDLDIMVQRVQADGFSKREAFEQIAENTNLELKEDIDKEGTIKVSIVDPDLISDDTLGTVLIKKKDNK